MWRACWASGKTSAGFQRDRPQQCHQGAHPGIGGQHAERELLLGFAGAFRRSELISLDLEQIELTDAALVLHLARGKTNQTGEVESKAVFYAGNPLLCPVRAFQD